MKEQTENTQVRAGSQMTSGGSTAQNQLDSNMVTIDRLKGQTSELKDAIEIGMDISKIVEKDYEQIQQKKLPKLASEV